MIKISVSVSSNIGLYRYDIGFGMDMIQLDHIGIGIINGMIHSDHISIGMVVSVEPYSSPLQYTSGIRSLHSVFDQIILQSFIEKLKI